MRQVKSAFKRIFRAAGFDIVRLPTSVAPPFQKKDYLFESDDLFKSIYREAIRISNSPQDPDVFPHRLYNTLQFSRLHCEPGRGRGGVRLLQRALFICVLPIYSSHESPL